MSDPSERQALARQIGPFDATMIVMGGIVGVGIFMNPYVVAQHLHSSAAILTAWLAGGVVALFGAFVYAELAARLPEAGGEYVYLREAIHPAAGFFYGWAALIVINGGGLAAVAATFAAYFRELVALPISDRAIGMAAIVMLTLINLIGVSAGTRVQSGLMLLRVAAVGLLVSTAAWWLGRYGLFARGTENHGSDPILSIGFLSSFASALVPIFFAYGGWQTANFVAGEVQEPKRNLPRALVSGVVGVIVLYVTLNWICVEVLGAGALAKSTAPASTVMRTVGSTTGAKLLSVGIALSALGFLSQSILTYPRVTYAMAADGFLPRVIGRLGRRSRVPILAILLNSAVAIVVLAVGRYDQILTYVESMDLTFFGLTAVTIFIFRRRDKPGCEPGRTFRTPGHPWTTGIFIGVCFLVVLNTLVRNRGNTLLVATILIAGAVVYWVRGHQVGKKGREHSI